MTIYIDYELKCIRKWLHPMSKKRHLAVTQIDFEKRQSIWEVEWDMRRLSFLIYSRHSIMHCIDFSQLLHACHTILG